MSTAASKGQTSAQTTATATTPSNLGTNKDKNNHLSRANCPGLTKPKISLGAKCCTIVGTRSDGQRFRPNICPRGNAPYKVKLTNGNGSEDCVLYFEDYQKCLDFFTKLVKADYANKNILGITTSPAVGSGLLVTTVGQGDFYTPNKMGCKSVSSDPNGYIEVETELGPAYILARKLNEEVEEEISLEENYMFECDNPKKDAFEDYNKYVEACSAQFDEFMR